MPRVVAGTAFMAPNKYGNCSHITFVLFDKNSEEPDVDDIVLVVNFTSVKHTLKDEDLSCVASRHDYEELTNDSKIAYNEAAEMRRGDISQGIKDGTLERKKKVPRELLKKAQAGAKKTESLIFRYVNKYL